MNYIIFICSMINVSLHMGAMQKGTPSFINAKNRRLLTVSFHYYEHEELDQPIIPTTELIFDASLIPLASKEERKAKKNADGKLLWDYVQHLTTNTGRTCTQDFDKTLSVLPEFKSYTAATAAATHSCYLPVLQLLHDHGANLEAKDAFGHTPLETAVIGHRAKNVTFLLSQRAILKPELLFRLCNPAQDAVKPGKMARIKTLQALLAFGANPNEIGEQGNAVEFLLRYSCGQKDFWKTADKDELQKKFLEQRKQMITHLLDAKLTANTIKAALDSTIKHPAFYHPELIAFLKTEIEKRP